MIFQHTWEKVLSGEKTQTRRIWKPEWSTAHYAPRNYYAIRLNARTVYQVGKTYAVQAGRGKPSVLISPDGKVVPDAIRYTGGINSDTSEWESHRHDGREFYTERGYKPLRICITDLWREDVRSIEHPELDAEGFESRWEFLQVWTHMHDKSASKEASRVGVLLTYEDWLDYLNQRPAERYDAVAIRFELVQS